MQSFDKSSAAEGRQSDGGTTLGRFGGSSSSAARPAGASANKKNAQIIVNLPQQGAGAPKPPRQKMSMAALLGGGRRDVSLSLSNSDLMHPTRPRMLEDAPKRPLSAYNLFFEDQRSEFLDDSEKKKYEPGFFANMARTIAKRWQQIPKEKLEHYEEEAKKDQERYKREMKEYNARRKEGRVDHRMPTLTTPQGGGEVVSYPLHQGNNQRGAMNRAGYNAMGSGYNANFNASTPSLMPGLAAQARNHDIAATAAMRPPQQPQTGLYSMSSTTPVMPQQLGDMPVKRKRGRPPGPAKSKKQKDPGMPRRGLTAYNLFFRDQRTKILANREASGVKAEGGGRENGFFANMAREIGRRWKELPPAELERYQYMGQLESIRYRREMKVYNRRVAFPGGGPMPEDDDDEEDDYPPEPPAIMRAAQTPAPAPAVRAGIMQPAVKQQPDQSSGAGGSNSQRLPGYAGAGGSKFGHESDGKGNSEDEQQKVPAPALPDHRALAEYYAQQEKQQQAEQQQQPASDSYSHFYSRHHQPVQRQPESESRDTDLSSKEQHGQASTGGSNSGSETLQAYYASHSAEQLKDEQQQRTRPNASSDNSASQSYFNQLHQLQQQRQQQQRSEVKYDATPAGGTSQNSRALQQYYARARKDLELSNAPNTAAASDAQEEEQQLNSSGRGSLGGQRQSSSYQSAELASTYRRYSDMQQHQQDQQEQTAASLLANSGYHHQQQQQAAEPVATAKRASLDLSASSAQAQAAQPQYDYAGTQTAGTEMSSLLGAGGTLPSLGLTSLSSAAGAGLTGMSSYADQFHQPLSVDQQLLLQQQQQTGAASSLFQQQPSLFQSGAASLLSAQQQKSSFMQQTGGAASSLFGSLQQQGAAQSLLGGAVAGTSNAYDDAQLLRQLQQQQQQQQQQSQSQEVCGTASSSTLLQYLEQEQQQQSMRREALLAAAQHQQQPHQWNAASGYLNNDAL